MKYATSRYIFHRQTDYPSNTTIFSDSILFYAKHATYFRFLNKGSTRHKFNYTFKKKAKRMIRYSKYEILSEIIFVDDDTSVYLCII
jgi:hypothetical protein